MKKLTNSDKAKMAMDSAIWNHGRAKGRLTIAIQKLKATGLGDHPDIKKVIELLTSERQKLELKELF